MNEREGKPKGKRTGEDNQMNDRHTDVHVTVMIRERCNTENSQKDQVADKLDTAFVKFLKSF